MSNLNADTSGFERFMRQCEEALAKWQAAVKAKEKQIEAEAKAAQPWIDKHHLN